MLPVGTLVALCHEQSDIPGSLCKALHRCNYIMASGIVFITTQVFWLYGRLYCLPRIIYEIFNTVEYGEGRSHLNPYINFSIVFLSVLVVLHVYWFCLFLVIDYNLIVNGDSKDVQNDHAG